MIDEFESIPQDTVEIREEILEALKAINIEPEPLREIFADIGLGVPLTNDLPEFPDVSREFMIALGISVLRKHDPKRFTATLRAIVSIFKSPKIRNRINYH